MVEPKLLRAVWWTKLIEQFLRNTWNILIIIIQYILNMQFEYYIIIIYYTYYI